MDTWMRGQLTLSTSAHIHRHDSIAIFLVTCEKEELKVNSDISDSNPKD